MLILALEASAKAASAAIARDGILLDMDFQNNGLTHSKTLLPMAEMILKRQKITLTELDAIAVSQGPGSFTGIRIGISTVKGLCWGAGKPAIGISTLEAMAWNAEEAPNDCIICCSMDARRNQVYNALFSFEEGKPKRLTEDRAIGLDSLSEELKKRGKPVFVLGDGAKLCYNFLVNELNEVFLAPESVQYQNAWGVCRAAEEYSPAPAGELLPCYLRLSQAERERLERMDKESKK